MLRPKTASNAGRSVPAMRQTSRLGPNALLDACDGPAVAALAELDRALARREDRVVLADPGARARPELRSALADEDHPGLHVLAGEDLHAEHLRVGVAPVPRRPEAFLVGHLVLPFLLRGDRGLERRGRTLALAVLALVGQGRLERQEIPGRRELGDLRDGQLRVALGHRAGDLGLRRLRLGLGLRLCSRLRLLRLLGSRRLRRADRLDLDAGQARAEAGVLLEAVLRAVLADPDLVAEHVLDDAGRDRGLRLQVDVLAVAADEEDCRLERLACFGLHAIDEQPFARLDAVLLAT